MRKLVLFITFLAPYLAFSQVKSGTIIIFNFTKDEFIVAADSRAMNTQPNIPPDDSQCKLRAFRHKIIFTTSGHTGRDGAPLSDPVGNWDNTEIAHTSIQSTDSSDKDANFYVSNVADKWAALALDKWQGYYVRHPDQVRAFAERGKGTLTTGVFAEVQGGEVHSALEGIVFNESIAGGPIVIGTGALNQQGCWPCGRAAGHQICAIGVTEIPAQICSHNPKFLSRSHSKHWNTEERFTAWLADITSACDLRGTVGGKTDVLDFDNKGRTRWLARKDNCPENED